MSGHPVPISNLPAGQKVLAQGYERQPPKIITDINYTLLEADAGRVLVFDSGGSQSVNIPSDLPAGWECEWIRGNAATDSLRLLFQGLSGVTMRSSSLWGPNAVYAGAPGARGHITRIASDVVAVTGDLLAQQPIDRPDWRVADIAARDLLTVTAADIGQVCRVASPLGFWRLAAVSPSLSWEQIGGGGSSGPDPLPLPAGAWIMRITTGAGIDGFETATHRINMDEVTFRNSATEHAQATFSWPAGASTCTARIYWRATAGTGDVRYRLRLRCFGDNQGIDQSFGTAQSVTDTLTAAGRLLITDATAAITPAGSVAAGNLCQIELDRDHTVSGNLNDLARVLMVRLEFQP